MTSTAAILGAGEIGAGWAARFLLMGWDVRVFDPEPAALERLPHILELARASLPGLYDLALPEEGQLTICNAISETVEGAIWIQESLPERLELKRKLLQQVQSHCDHDAIIGSSSSGFSAPDIQGCATRAAQIVIAHPANPVYLLPLVELGGSQITPPDILARAEEILTGIGLSVLRLNSERPSSVSARLQKALWQEAQALIQDHAATPAQINAAISQGFALTWAQMGPFQIDQSRGEDSGDAAAQMQGFRDGNLVTLLRGLKARGAGAGTPLRAHEASLEKPRPDCTKPPITLLRQVPQDWVDYNGHMNEARYLQAFSNACDRLLEWAGMDAACIAAGHSIFTVETHIQHLGEVDIGETIHVTTRVLQGGGKKFHIWQEMWKGPEKVATCEQMLLHVDLTTRRSALPPEGVAQALAQMARDHGALPQPEGLGRAIGTKA